MHGIEKSLLLVDKPVGKECMRHLFEGLLEKKKRMHM